MKNKLKDNLFIKIIAVCIAIILWFYIQMVQNPEIEYTFTNMRVSLVNSSLLEERNLIVISDDEYRADITVNCPRWSLSELNDEDFVAYVDLSEVKSSGLVELPVKVRINNENIIVSSKSPSTVKISIDTIINVEKDLVVHTTGNVKDNYYSSDDLIVPDTDKIMARGPKSLLNKVENGVITVDYSNKNQSFTNVYDVILVDKEGTAIASDKITVLNDNVSVDVTIMPTKKVPVVIENLPSDIKYSITPLNIEIAGSEEVLDTMNEIVVNNFYLSDRSAGHTQNISIKLPDNVILVNEVIPQIKILAN